MLIVAKKRASTVEEYIKAAPTEGQTLLHELFELLQSIAPEAETLIKWGAPFFVEPRYLFSFSAHKAHLNFSPMAASLEPFREELKQHRTTKNFLQVPYGSPLPTDLIRRIAEHRLQVVNQREDESFW